MQILPKRRAIAQPPASHLELAALRTRRLRLEVKQRKDCLALKSSFAIDRDYRSRADPQHDETDRH